MKNGKRASEIPLDLYQQGTILGKSPYWKSVTNGDGIACPSELPDGKYEIFAKSARRSAELDIDVSKKNEVNGFEIALHLSDQLDAAVRTPTAIWVQAFRGVIQDASGAVMPKGKIEVLRRDGADVFDENPVLKTQSNQRGHFFCDLEKGTYVAIFEYPGFDVTAFPFEVNPKGWNGLKVTMQVGDMNRTAPIITEFNAQTN